MIFHISFICSFVCSFIERCVLPIYDLEVIRQQTEFGGKHNTTPEGWLEGAPDADGLPEGWLDGDDEIDGRPLGCELGFSVDVGLVVG